MAVAIAIPAMTTIVRTVQVMRCVNPRFMYCHHVIRRAITTPAVTIIASRHGVTRHHRRLTMPIVRRCSGVGRHRVTRTLGGVTGSISAICNAHHLRRRSVMTIVAVRSGAGKAVVNSLEELVILQDLCADGLRCR